MSSLINTQLTPESPSPDSPGAIAAGITLAVVGIAYFMASPVIVGALTEYGGFSEHQAGLLAAIEAGGSFLASIIISLTVDRFDRRKLATAAILVAVAANLAMTQTTEFYVTAAFRSLSGLGSGAMYALGLASLAGSQNTSRNFSILLFVQVSFGMLEINLFSWLAVQAGMNGIYFTMAGAFALCLGLVMWLPSSAPLQQSQPSSLGIGSRFHMSLPWACLVAVFLFYTGVGAFWTYIERIGLSGGLGAEVVHSTLTWTQLLSLLGCVVAAGLSARFGEFRPLILSLVCAAGASYGLTMGITQTGFIIALCTFFLFWNAIDIYQLGTLGNMDHRGRFVALVPAFQTTATASGPALAAVLLGNDGNYSAVLVMAGSTTLVSALVYFFVYFLLRHSELGRSDAGAD